MTMMSSIGRWRLRQGSRPASVLYFACRILNVVGTSDSSAFAKLKGDHDLLLILTSVSITFPFT